MSEISLKMKVYNIIERQFNSGFCNVSYLVQQYYVFKIFSYKGLVKNYSFRDEYVRTKQKSGFICRIIWPLYKLKIELQ